MKAFYILIAIVILGFIVTIHELGHFIVGRLCGIGVLEFSVGFGPKIFGFRRKETDYSLRAIPLGGYCKFVGDEEEGATAPNSMNNAPVWKRMLTVFAGPAMNFILAFVFCVILLAGFYVAEYLPVVSYIEPDLPAASCGLETGDVITAINGVEIAYSQEGILTLQETMRSSDLTAPIVMTIDRNGEEKNLSARLQEVVDEETGTVSYMLGVSFGARSYTFGEALTNAFDYTIYAVETMVDSLKNLIFKGEGADEVRGTVGIISFMSDLVYNEKLYAVVNLIFIISLNLGIMNLLPLPALDGGRLIFLIIEAIRRKPLPPEKEGMVHGIGMLLLLAVFVLITYQDIVRLIAGG